MSKILETIKEKCIKGKRVELLEEVKRALAQGVDAKTVMNEALIPAMSTVGEKYSSGEFFRPRNTSRPPSTSPGSAPRSSPSWHRPPERARASPPPAARRVCP